MERQMKKASWIYILIAAIIICLGCPIGNPVIYAEEMANGTKTGKQVTEIAGNATETDAGFYPADAPSINASAAIVMNIDTGDILYEKKPHERMYPAGITKVMTALLAVENTNVNDTIKISDSVMSQLSENSSVVGYKLGEVITVRDALYAIMFSASSDASLALSEYMAGSSSEFAELMNNRAQELGCADTHFTNPTGVHNEDMYASCYDMAIIGRTAYQYPEYRNLISALSYTMNPTNMSDERTLWTENLFLYGSSSYYYKYSTGGKTGFTDNALYTLLSYAEKDGSRLICVVMRCDTSVDTFKDSQKLFDFCFDNYRLCKPTENYDINSEINKNSDILSNYYGDLDHELPRYYVNQNYSVLVRSKVSDSEIEKRLEMYPKLQGDVAGKLTFYYDGSYYGETDIFISLPVVEASSTDAIKKEKNVPEGEPLLFTIIRIVVPLIIVILLIILILYLLKKIKKEIQLYRAKSTVKYFPIKRDKRKYPDKKTEDQGKKKKNDKEDSIGESKEKKSKKNDKDNVEGVNLDDGEKL